MSANFDWRGQRALITGASAGIGQTFAEMAAARSCHLVLTARRIDRLEALAATLRAKHGVEVDCIAADLADPAAAQSLCVTLAERGLAIDVLVNNAGFGVPGAYHQSDWPTQARFLQVMVDAPCELAHRLLPGMRDRGRGAIVNVASLAGLVPGSAGSTLYGGAKSMLIKFSQSLSLETAGRGIRVQALCPGFTYSEFHDVTGARALVSRMPKFLWMDAASVVQASFDALDRDRVICVPGRINRLLKFIAKHLPDQAALRLVGRRSNQFRSID
jgi:short-subunit dehydrogenase